MLTMITYCEPEKWKQKLTFLNRLYKAFSFRCESFAKSSRPQDFFLKSVLQRFAKFTRKHLRWSLCFNESAHLQAATCTDQKKSPAQVFLMDFETFKNMFFIEHRQTTWYETKTQPNQDMFHGNYRGSFNDWMNKTETNWCFKLEKKISVSRVG